jgi:integrase
MSKAEPAPDSVLPGERHPDNPRKVCVQDPLSKKKRWLVATKRLGKLKAAEFQKLDQSSAITKWHKLTDNPNSQTRTSDRVLPNGSVEHPWKRTVADIKKHLSHFTCGICGTDYKANPNSGNESGNFCGGCKPWARLSLTAEHIAKTSDERAAIYAKIVKLRRVFEGDGGKATEGSGMQFSLLAQRWDETNPRSNRNSGSNQSYAIRLLTLYFDDMRADEMSGSKALAFREHISHEEGRRGLRAQTTINDVMSTLRLIYVYAEMRGWVKQNPFADVRLTSIERPLKSDRLVTVEEEERLLAACADRFDSLRVAILCLADTGMYERDRRDLKWADVDLENGLLWVRGRRVEMTPRLREALNGCSDRAPLSPVMGREQHPTFLAVCAVAGLEDIVLSDFRRTAAWRMKQAGWSFERIASTLGASDLNRLRLLLEINPAIAQHETSSPSFQRFLEEQFGAPANGNGNGQKNDERRSPHRDKDDRDQWLLGIINKMVMRYRAERRAGDDEAASSRRRKLIQQQDIASDLELTVQGLRDRLDGCGWREMFPTEKKRYHALLAFVAAGVERGDTDERILDDLKNRLPSTSHAA